MAHPSIIDFGDMSMKLMVVITIWVEIDFQSIKVVYVLIELWRLMGCRFVEVDEKGWIELSIQEKGIP